jgi:Fe2+ or Zn2+ uptake regulation protein
MRRFDMEREMPKQLMTKAKIAVLEALREQRGEVTSGEIARATSRDANHVSTILRNLPGIVDLGGRGAERKWRLPHVPKPARKKA